MLRIRRSFDGENQSGGMNQFCSRSSTRHLHQHGAGAPGGEPVPEPARPLQPRDAAELLPRRGRCRRLAGGEAGAAPRLRRGREGAPGHLRARRVADRVDQRRERRGQDGDHQVRDAVPRPGWGGGRRGVEGRERRRHVQGRAAGPGLQPSPGGLREREDPEERQLVPLRQVHRAAVRRGSARVVGERPAGRSPHQDVPPREGARAPPAGGRADLPHLLPGPGGRQLADPADDGGPASQPRGSEPDAGDEQGRPGPAAGRRRGGRRCAGGLPGVPRGVLRLPRELRGHRAAALRRGRGVRGDAVGDEGRRPRLGGAGRPGHGRGGAAPGEPALHGAPQRGLPGLAAGGRDGGGPALRQGPAAGGVLAARGGGGGAVGGAVLEDDAGPGRAEAAPHPQHHAAGCGQPRRAGSAPLRRDLRPRRAEDERVHLGRGEHATFCGVLDIFGFEFFQTNSFEQLCINYTNELLQQYFNEFIFENEAALYREEGIAWEPEDFPDNASIVALLHERVRGVLPMLEEECFSIGGSSDRWGSKLIKEHEGHKNFSIIRNKQGVFVLQHFAGPVTYTVDGFLEKNKDELSTDILACMRSSRKPFVSARFSEGDRVFGSGPRRGAAGEAAAGAPLGSPRAPGGGGGERVLRAKRYTVSSEFREQLHELLGQIHQTVPHFVRCIKPNPKNRPFEEARAGEAPRPLFSRAQVAEQLSYQGVLEAVRVARAGYPVRFAHGDFYVEFGCLVCPKLRAHLEAEAQAAGEFTAAAVQQMLESGEMQAALSSGAEPARRGWALGRTRVFLKQEPSNALRVALGRARHAAATRLQAAARRRAASRRYARFSWALRRLQACWRGAVVRGEMWREKREAAATLLAAAARTLRARQRFHTARRAALVSQAWGRMRWCRKRYLADRARLTQLQRWWRSLQKRRRWRNLQQNMLRIQRCWRGSRGRLQALELKVRSHRLKVAVRALLRLRRRSLAQREWRAKMMQFYLHREPVPAPSRELVLRDITRLRTEYEAMYKEVQSFRAERAEWERRLEALRSQAWTRVRGMFTAEPA
ncbi:unnamed protein product [Prorocentrum cordatum]|uniref:Myosin motor domain-containing protein n=1 Tax=Prorocentrum cordatum TaxID=2364126 RepID=A0ABN9V1P0_9DINO|nr:unnamed protein product [Polarella glacialis]